MKEKDIFKKIRNKKMFGLNNEDKQELERMAKEIHDFCEKRNLQFVIAINLFTEAGDDSVKDQRFAVCAVNQETPSPYIMAAAEIANCNIHPGKILALAAFIQEYEKDGDENDEDEECDCPLCQRKRERSSAASTSNTTIH